MLTAGEHARIHEFVRLTLDWLEQRGFVLTVESDMRAWADLMRSSPRIVGVNPTYDPDQSHLTPANAFWLRLQQNGRTIACSANRFFATYDRFGCPMGQAGLAFRCLVQLGEGEGEGDPGLSERAQACWENPALDPASLMPAQEPPVEGGAATTDEQPKSN